MKVFVYGTLKSGHGNNVVLDGAKFVTKAVVDGFKLYNSGFPAARESEDDSVTGEVWDIEDNKQILARLDRLEGYRENDPSGSFYIRKKVKTQCGIEAEMYVGNRFNFDRLQECPNENRVYTWG